QLGIWDSEFEMPWDYRRGSSSTSRNQPSSTTRPAEQHPTPQQKADQGDCLIKGNISSSGEKIYHPPDSPWYSRTKIDTTKGERWFCSEEEAGRAGWRRAKY